MATRNRQPVLYSFDCLRCGHHWIPRIRDVRICPNCKSARWDEPRRSAMGRLLLTAPRQAASSETSRRRRRSA